MSTAMIEMTTSNSMSVKPRGGGTVRESLMGYSWVITKEKSYDQ
jgi:hypothetical protein